MNKISPCVGVCSIDRKSNLCLGCLRSSDEIAIWPQIDNKKALEIMKEIKKRSPIWKKEHYTNNQSDWLKGNPIVNEKN